MSTNIKPDAAEFFNTLYCSLASWDNTVGKATHYGLDGLGIKSWWGRDFPCLSRLAPGLTQPPIQWVLGLFPGSKAAEERH